MSLQANQPTKTDLKLVQFLNEYLPFIDHCTPTFIDEGGCGYFAYFLSQALDKMNISNQIVFLVPKKGFGENGKGPDKELEFQRKVLNDHLQNGTNFPSHYVPIHCVVQLEQNICVDNKGLMNGGVNELELFEIPSSTVLELSKDRKRWNEVFDVSCLGNIQTMLDEMPFEYGKWLQGQRYLPDGPGKVNEYTVNMKRKYAESRMFASISGSLNQDMENEGSEG